MCMLSFSVVNGAGMAQQSTCTTISDDELLALYNLYTDADGTRWTFTGVAWDFRFFVATDQATYADYTSKPCTEGWEGEYKS
jgi:hypothetical protein